MKMLFAVLVTVIIVNSSHASSLCDSVRIQLLSMYDSLTSSEKEASWFRCRDSVLGIQWNKRKLSVMAESLKIYSAADTTGYYDDLLLETLMLLGRWNEAESQISSIAIDSAGWSRIVDFRHVAWDLENKQKEWIEKLKQGTADMEKGSFKQQRLLALYELSLGKRMIGINRLREIYDRYKTESGADGFQHFIKSIEHNSGFAGYLYVSTSDLSIYTPHYNSVRGAGFGFNIGSQKMYGIWRIGFEHNTLEQAVSVKRNDGSYSSCKDFIGFGMDFGTNVRIVSGHGYRLGILGTVGYMISTYESAKTEGKLQEVSDLNGCYSIGPTISYTTLGGKYLFAELLFRHVPSNLKHQYPEFERSRVVLQVGFGGGGDRN